MAAFDLTVNVEGFLLSMQPATDSGTSGTAEQWEEGEGERLLVEDAIRSVLLGDGEADQGAADQAGVASAGSVA